MSKNKNEKGEMVIMKGKVNWFNEKKGYGFIKVDGLESDVFVHFTDIQMEGYKTLKKDDLVTFEIEDGENGSKAVKVVKIEEE